MSRSSEHEGEGEPLGRQWSHLALFASLSTAVDVAAAVRERRMGRDPSEQEVDRDAISYLNLATAELRVQLVRLRVFAAARTRGALVSEVQRFPGLMVLLRATRLLHRIHQRLLSLYPSAEVDAIETVRILHKNGTFLVEGLCDDFDGGLNLWIEATARFVDDIVLASDDPGAAT